ncbi:hypothetical protein CR203_18315 [Salipaludibacillus neizhouensis]|uniref:Antitoxin SocA-like Panacea domain-containing protein n=1 Tax=Salipaludibacillus neizhouensis TaxID=885475 RepID=A0A3A9KM43_9BACI|nr:type II toxin-antitoxin system antitoxin SocA domain-containing protein [Salipaludibacillus neizhouensis]RKL65816.1 hypothetical protein CR203_18315 [Salipaludibacillus neizhouensis]
MSFLTKAKYLNATDVARYFLHLSSLNNIKVTPLKLQKLVYFAQAWHLAIKEKELFKDKIEAWTHGPVVPSLYQEYKSYGFGTITPLHDIDSDKYKDEEEETFNLVWELYGEMDGKALENITHSEDPWIKAREGLSLNDPSNNEITTVSLKDYFKEYMN